MDIKAAVNGKKAYITCIIAALGAIAAWAADQMGTKELIEVVIGAAYGSFIRNAIAKGPTTPDASAPK